MSQLTFPLIGIVVDYKDGKEHGAGSYSKSPYYALRVNYVNMISGAGAAAVLIPYDHDKIDFYLDLIDGLMIVGGHFDIDPIRYNENEIHPTAKLNKTRENFEYVISKKALEKKTMPILGICNGMQLINVLHGGDLIQHIPDDKKFINHEQSKVEGFESAATPYHDVIINKNSKLFKIAGEEKIKTNSSHHQGVKSVGKGLLLSGEAIDGTVEAVESIDHDFCIGVQWHPEFDTNKADEKIFNKFVEAAKIFKGKK